VKTGDEPVVLGIVATTRLVVEAVGPPIAVGFVRVVTVMEVVAPLGVVTLVGVVEIVEAVEIDEVVSTEEIVDEEGVNEEIVDEEGVNEEGVEDEATRNGFESEGQHGCNASNVDCWSDVEHDATTQLATNAIRLASLQIHWTASALARHPEAVISEACCIPQFFGHGGSDPIRVSGSAH